MHPLTALRTSLSSAVLGFLLLASLPAPGLAQTPGPRPRRTKTPPEQQPPPEQPPPQAQEPAFKQYEPKTEPAQEPAQPATEPPATEPPAADPAREPATEPAPEPAHDATPATEPTSQPAAEPTAEPAATPAPETTSAPAPETPASTESAAPAATGPVSAVAPRTETADGGLPRRVRLGLTFAETQDGMVVRDVAPRSAAASAGLRVGDVVLKINAAPVQTADALVSRLAFIHPGEPVTFAVLRAGESLDLQVVPDEALREGDLEAKVEYGAFAGSKARLRSVWSLPKGEGAPRPAVLIVRGVGASPADAPGNNPLRDLSFQLARAGVIAVRYDPQGVGDSEGLPNPTVDFDAEVADARAALAYVRADARVDPDRVFLLGQGTGGGVAAVVASGDQKLAGLAVIGMIARPLMEYLLDSRRQQLSLAGVAPAEVDDILREHVALYAGLVADGRLPASDPYGIVGADGTLMGKSIEFWREYDRVNYAKLFTDLKVPVLNAIGEFDYVSTLADHRVIADALKAKGQDGQALVLFDHADHDLRTFDSREAAFAAFGSADAPVNDRALSTIVEWVQAHLKGATTAQ